MEYVNDLYKTGATHEDITVLAKLLGPFAPHLSAEMLEHLKADDVWPNWDEKELIEDEVEIVIQVNGKLRAKIKIAAADLNNQAVVEGTALQDENVQKFVKSAPKKTIYVPRAKLLNIVV